MKDMDKAVKRLDRAIRESEKILVYGDYDVDGTTAVALVYSFLRKGTPMVSYYIPDRYTEGYGISYIGIDAAAEEGCTLIIALDCGIKATERWSMPGTKGLILSFATITFLQMNCPRRWLCSTQKGTTAITRLMS